MSSSNSKNVKKWQAFVSRLAKQANFVCDGPIEVYSFTNPEGSEARIENLSQLRQIFQDHALSNQLHLHLKATASDGAVHHTSISIRRPARRRRHETHTSSQASDDISHDSSQTHDSSRLATGSTSLVLQPAIPSPMSMPDYSDGQSANSMTQSKSRVGSQRVSPIHHHDTSLSPARSHIPPQTETTTVSMSLSPQSRSLLDQTVSQTTVLPRPPPLQTSPSAPQPPAVDGIPEPLQTNSATLSSLEEQRHQYYRDRGKSEPENQNEEPEVPRRLQPSVVPPTSVSPFVSPPRELQNALANLPPQDNTDLTASIWSLTSQLQFLIQQQQQQMAVQTANTVAAIGSIQNEAHPRSRSSDSSSVRSSPSPEKESRSQRFMEFADTRPVESPTPPLPPPRAEVEPSNALSEKLDKLSHHISQIGSVVEKFNESAKLIHESVQNLMTTSLQLQHQQMSMSQMLPPGSFMVTGIQTPQGIVYQPVSDLLDGMQRSVQPVFSASVASSYVSSGTPVLQAVPALLRPQDPPLVDDLQARMGPAQTQPSSARSQEVHFAEREYWRATEKLQPRQRSLTAEDVLNPPRLDAVSPPIRTSSARLARRTTPRARLPSSSPRSYSDSQAPQMLVRPRQVENDPGMMAQSSDGLAPDSPQLRASSRGGAGSTGSVPSGSGRSGSDPENAASSQRLSASGGSNDSGISEDLKEKLQILKDMGHTNRTFNLVLLQQNNGDIDSVLADLKQFEQYK